MAFYGDPDELDRIAATIEGEAERVRGRAADLVTAGESMRWVSVAADRCRALLRADRAALQACADRLDAAAAALRQHAQQVRELIALIASVMDTVTGWFRDAAAAFERAVDTFADAAADFFSSDVVDVFVERPRAPRPPWDGLPFGPNDLPPAGDRRWLEVGRVFDAAVAA